MTKKDWFGIAYVAAWVMIWGTIGSLIDLPFLNAEIYLAGSVGQVTTFFMTALISIILASLLFPKLLSTRMLAKALGLDTEENN